MEQFILQLGIMSLQASVVICVVLFMREIFSRVGISKKYINVLWLLPYVCMICPWKFEGEFGFWRQLRNDNGALAQAVSQIRDLAANETSINQNEQAIVSTIGMNANTAESIGLIGNSDLGVLSAPVTDSLTMDGLQMVLTMISIIWFVGLICLILYSADAHLKLHRKLICCLHVGDNIYLADDIKVPFVMGIFNPRIYLPNGMTEMNKMYVLAHEKTHIRHMDPLKKCLAFLITCLHWFNPLAWVAFHFYSKDMEMACDEETVLQLGMEHKQNYAQTLLSLATGRRLFLGAPLAFDEGNVKSRLKNIVKYKKTWRVLSVLAVVVIVVLAVGFMTREGEYKVLSKVQDMVHPSKETKVVIVTLDDQTRYFAGEGYVEEISEFLNRLEIKKSSENNNYDEEWPMDAVLEFGTQRFCFNAEYDIIWSDSDVKASSLYQVKNPEEVKAYLEGLFGNITIDNDTISTETATSEVTKIEEAARESEVRELTMEELITLCKIRPEMLAQTVGMIPWGEEGPSVPAIYNNLELGIDHEGRWTGNYFCYLTHEGKEYRVQFGFDTDTKALWGIYLYYPKADDMILLYTDEPERYTVTGDIQEFLDREYKMDDFFTCTLPEGTRLGDYKIYYNDVFHGCPILGDFEELIHGEGTLEAWYVPGCILTGANDEHNDRMQFENGKAVSARWIGNHRWMDEAFEYVEGCEMQALLYEAHFDLFTAAESYEYMQEHNLTEEEMQFTSHYWYVFMGEEDSEYIYIVALNQAYFTKEDVIKLARSVEITYE